MKKDQRRSTRRTGRETQRTGQGVKAWGRGTGITVVVGALLLSVMGGTASAAPED